MFLIVSNTGSWEYDMWGVVGVIGRVEDLPRFIKSDGKHSSSEMNEYTRVSGTDACYRSFEENEVNFLCSGTPVSYAIRDEEGCFPTIYYVVQLEEPSS